MTPYRDPPKAPPAWLLVLDRVLDLRQYAPFRRYVGGVWERLCAPLVPGCPEWWHHNSIDAPPQVTTRLVDRETYS